MTPTSLISLIFEPPFPISEPHWLPGKTRRSVTGGLLVTLLFVIAALISLREIQKYVFPHTFQEHAFYLTIALVY